MTLISSFIVEKYSSINDDFLLWMIKDYEDSKLNGA